MGGSVLQVQAHALLCMRIHIFPWQKSSKKSEQKEQDRLLRNSPDKNWREIEETKQCVE